MHHIFKSVALASLVLLVSCNKQEQQQTPASDSAKIVAAPVKEGEGRGIVMAIDTAHKSMTLDHNNIPNVMDAMAMDYKVDNPSLLQAAKVGDSVVFTLQDRGEGNFVVTKITPIKK